MTLWRTLKFLTGWALFFSIAGCGKSGGTPTLVGTGPTSPVIDSLMYQPSDPAVSHSSRFLAAPDGIQLVLNNLGGGAKLYADVLLFLLPNHQYTLIYDESVGCSNGQGIIKERVAHKPVQGSWSLQGKSLKLPPVGSGQAMTLINGARGLNLNFNENLGRSGLKGQSVFLQAVVMPSDLNDNLSGGFLTDYDSAVQSLTTTHVCVN